MKQTVDGATRILDGHAQIQSNTMLIRADHIEYNEETRYVVAQGSDVTFTISRRTSSSGATHLRYNTGSELGELWDVRGELPPKIVNRRGILSVSSPFYFKGQFAEPDRRALRTLQRLGDQLQAA